MRILCPIVGCLLALRAAVSAPPPDPFRVVPTPTGCAFVFEGVPDEYRVDALVDGGVRIGLQGISLPSQERQMPGTCVAKIRISPGYGGNGTTLEVRPIGVEFSGVIRSADSLQVTFERVVNLSGAQSDPDPVARSYRLGVGDTLKITVYNHEDLTKEVAIAPGGMINYSLVGEIQAAGRTVHELQDELISLLGKDYIVNPQLAVEVKAYASQFIYVNGQVKTPGRFPLQGGLSLKDAISLAGGFGQDAGYSITVARQRVDAAGQEQRSERIQFGRQDIDVGQANLQLVSGDVVTVSEKDYVYIQSEVREPGKYELGSGLTLLRAIAVAKGLTDWADKKRVALIRVVGGQTIRETINLKDVERQKSPDVPLVPGDIIIVPRRIL